MWPVWVGICVLVALALRLPVLTADLVHDDFVQFAMVDGDWPDRAPWDLYRFYDGELAANAQLRDDGRIPWYSAPNLRGGVLRPVTSLLLWFDYSVFGPNPIALRLSSLAWVAALIVAAGAFLRRILPVQAAGLALLLYAAAEAHAVPAVWIANRGSWVAATFACVALWAFVRWRGEGWGQGKWLAPVAFGLALFSGEYALGAMAFMGTYAIVIDRAPWAHRLRSLVPIAAIFLVHAALFVGFGYGATGGHHYVDPYRDPLAFLARFEDGFAPIVLTGVLPVPTGTNWPHWADWPQWAQGTPGAIAAILLPVAALSALVFLGLRGKQRRIALWLLLASLLSCVPILAVQFSARLLVLSSLGFCAVIALGAIGALSRARERQPSGTWVARVSAWSAVALGASLVLLHLVVPPVEGHDEMTNWARDASAALAAVRDAPVTADRPVVVFADPTLHHPPLVLASLHRDAPPSWHAISPSREAHRLFRADEREFILTLAGELEYTGNGVVFTGDKPLSGAPVRAGSLVLQVLQRAPQTILRVRFEEPLDSYQFLTLRDGEYRRVKPPPVGGSLELPPASM